MNNKRKNKTYGLLVTYSSQRTSPSRMGHEEAAQIPSRYSLYIRNDFLSLSSQKQSKKENIKKEKKCDKEARVFLWDSFTHLILYLGSVGQL
jgi:hypothetical protein